MRDASSNANVSRYEVPSSKLFGLAQFCIGLAVLVFLAFPSVLLGTASFYSRDFLSFGYPLAFHVQESYRAGEIPLWNPYNFAGLPFLAQWNALCLYPGSLFYVLFPLPWSLNFFNVGHLYLGGVGMYLLARFWIRDERAASLAGVAYAFGGMLISSLMWPNNISALGLLPFVMLASDKAVRAGGKWLVMAALTVAMQFLTGAPEIVIFTWTAAALLALLHSPEIGFGAVFMRSTSIFCVALGLVMIQLLPFLELLRHSQRGAAYSSADWSLDWAGLGNFLVPLFRTVKDRDGVYFQANQQWVTSYYAGISVLTLAIIGIITERSARARLLTVCGLMAFVLALGSHAHVYDWIRKGIPLAGIMRYPIKFIVPLVVVIPLLAAYGSHTLFERRASIKFVWTAFSAIALLVGVILFFNPIFPGDREDVRTTWQSGILATGFLISTAAVLVLSLRSSNAGLVRLLHVLVVILVFCDLIFANRGINPLANPALLKGNVAELDPRPALGQARAMVSSKAHLKLDATLFPNSTEAIMVPRQSLMLDANLLESLPKLDGFFSLYIPAAATTIGEVSKGTNSAEGLLDFLSVSHVNDTQRPWHWEKRNTWLPYVTIPPHELFLQSTNALSWILSASFRPVEHVVLDGSSTSDAPTNGTSPARVLSSRVRAHVLEAVVEASVPCVAVVSQANYPGWQARVDGQRVPILKANYAFQAVRIPAGNHTLRLIYNPTSFTVGASLSLLTLAGCAVWCFNRRRPRVQ